MYAVRYLKFVNTHQLRPSGKGGFFYKGGGKMPQLKANPTLKDFQQYVLQMKQERGFNTTDKFYECCLLA